MKCKNKIIKVIGTEYNDLIRSVKPKMLECICTNDEKGKTLSINNGVIQFTISFEKIAECFKDN